jgi:class 3 adenylate cyclase/pimeloyl-ACP methyl ester carboxylesterase
MGGLMPSPYSNRKLAAIIAADIVGYTRLMGEDEAGTLAAVKRVFEEVVTPAVQASNGRIVKTMGDGYLVEYTSATEAAACAVDWQKRVREAVSCQSAGGEIVFRIGINLGEVYVEDGDILGDGVNLAARLEAICPPGGICVSEMIKNTTGSDLPVQFTDFGLHRLKNVKSPVHAYLIAQSHLPEVEREPEPGISRQSTVRYCQSKDGTSIAHAVVGEGYPLVLAGSWMTHLEWDWEAPSTRDYLSHLSKHFTVIRYDQRGNGMSDWDDVDITFDKMVDDRECVIDQYDYEQVAILGMSQGASVAIAYMARRPSKVSHLVLNGGYARGRRRRGRAKDNAESEALVNMIRFGWATENPAFRQAMTMLFMPDASAEEANWFNAFQKACGPGENMARFREMFDEMDVSEILQNIQVPTLIVHSDDDAIAPISEGKFLASRISGAKFVRLNSKNHMMFGNEPDFPKLINSITSFVR